MEAMAEAGIAEKVYKLGLGAQEYIPRKRGSPKSKTGPATGSGVAAEALQYCSRFISNIIFASEFSLLLSPSLNSS